MPHWPDRIETPRLELVPNAEDALDELVEAVVESFSELNPWMEWAAELPTSEELAGFVRRSRAAHEKGSSDVAFRIVGLTSGRLLGVIGIPHLDASVPSFEIGYWCRTSEVGRGYVSEATAALVRYLFEHREAARVLLRMDDLNERSWRVAERLGFVLEGVFQNDLRANDGSLRRRRYYAMTSLSQLREPTSGER